MRPALVRQHGPTGPPGVLAEWLETRGIPFVVDRSWLGAPVPDPTEHCLVASLGSRHGPGDTHVPLVADEVALIARAVEAQVPVLGLCFGGQVLASVLGGTVARAPVPELGWREIDTDDADAVPAGPWLEWHFDRFTVPPGARELARTPEAAQAFALGAHLGVQFHPESTVDVVAGWARADVERLRALGIADGAALLAVPAVVRQAARAAAFALFDGFLARAGLGPREAEEAGATAGRRG